MEMVGANPSASVTGLTSARREQLRQRLRPVEVGHRHANYGQVAYQGLYSGVDMVFHGNPTQLQYDFLVAAGADPGQSTCTSPGPTASASTGPATSCFRSGAARSCRAPRVLYQDVDGVRVPVEGHYVLERDDQVGSSIGDYDYQPDAGDRPDAPRTRPTWAAARR